jgi:hypothetical protein
LRKEQTELSTGAHVFAVQSTLNEIKRAIPDVSNIFLFNKNGEITAKDNDTDPSIAGHAAEILNALTKKADVIGGLESITFYGSHRRMNISCMDDYHLATAASKESDQKYTETLARISLSTILRLIDSLQLVTDQEQTAPATEPEFPTKLTEAEETSSENQVRQSEPAEPEHEIKQPEPELEYEPSLTEVSATQFIVEHIGGLLVPPDTVRIDNALMLKWKELYGDKKISEVEVETLGGQTTRCKVKPIKDSKLEGKGLIQIPVKIQTQLETSQGELVMAKPVIV